MEFLLEYLIYKDEIELNLGWHSFLLYLDR